MVKEKKVAAFFAPWKLKIARLKRGDHVFLYRSGTGVVAIGKADGKLKKAAYHGKPENRDEEYAMSLLDFALVVGRRGQNAHLESRSRVPPNDVQPGSRGR
jgi:hypothetical protein